ncbi:NADH dehydrogenase [ubiquinone] 1 beta subcomplex subunit 8, mitochondrial [Planococcus citri]|uniref:NADH dehydrogenase [ubiquinone] 1 beta subcomplex subunit 8, mitochondrial n=1 Tax=Planococcus citri TaxID=170843 RepID=UPI0031F8C340
MNTILSKSRVLLRAGVVFHYRQPIRGAVRLDVDWMPGPYPKNEKERLAAAKKYNLLPEEYEPLDPKWDVGMGDYPVLPNRSFDCKDPYGDYEYMSDARHFGQPVHHGWEVLTGQGMNLSLDKNPEYFSYPNAILLTWIMCLLTYYYTEWDKNFPFITEIKPLHKPGQGVHYHYPTSDLHMYD